MEIEFAGEGHSNPTFESEEAGDAQVGALPSGREVNVQWRASLDPSGP